MKANRFFCLVLLYAIFSGFLIKTTPAQNEDSVEKKAPKGLRFRLREATEKTALREPATPAAAEKLGPAETEAIFRRLPPMPVEPRAADFSKRAESLPPPKVGQTIPVKFPAAATPAAPVAENSESLKIVRFSPEKQVAFATNLSVTFSQPMVPVSAQNRAAAVVPVELTPPVPGKWRWLGTKTLIFEAAGRFPMATRFTARIPAGTRSATGAALENETVRTFETPPPKVESFLSEGATIRRDALLLAGFNQRIDPAAVLAKINAAVTPNGQKIPLRLATPEELAANPALSGEIEKLPASQWLVFRAVEPLPAGSRINLAFEAGLPSAEGALTSASARNFSFKTYGALEFVESGCGYGEEKQACKRYDPLRLEFSNPLDRESFDTSLVRIEPPLEDAEISVSGNRIEIGGCCRKARRTYKVKIDGALRDEFGQTLGRDVTAKFRVGADAPELTIDGGESDFMTLDPHAKRRLTIVSKNHRALRVKLFAVKPEDFGLFEDYRRNETKAPPAVGRLVSSYTMKVKAKRDEPAETRIDLAPALTNELGHAVLFVEPDVETPGEDRETLAIWIEATQIGLDVFADYENLTVYASRLKDGKPLKNVNLKLAGAGGRGTPTGDDGLATLETPGNFQKNWLIAENGADTAIIHDPRTGYTNRPWSHSYEPETLRWFVFDDRRIYRPGETVSVKGYLRRVAAGKLSDIGELGDAVRGLRYVLRDSLGNEVARGTAALNMFGAFDFQLKMPDNINLGSETLHLTADSSLAGRDHRHWFLVEEFRRPEFEVTAKNESVAPYYVGGAAAVSVEAKYYAGGALAGADVKWTVESRPARYTPPNRDDFTFGKFVPWWKYYSESDRDERTSETLEERADAAGRHRLALDFLAANPARPYTITAEARVTDVNRQAFAGSTTLLVHPAELYLGLRTPKTFVGRDEVLRVEAIATDIDGKAVAGAPVSIVAELKDWKQVKGEWREVTVEIETCRITSTNDVGACEFKPKRGGIYTIAGTVLDRKERRNESELDVWVEGAEREPNAAGDKESVELIPGKKEYAPGETAEILVNAPFPQAEGVLTLRRNGIVKTERFTISGTSTVLKIPVEERFLPNFYVRVDLLGASKRVIFGNELDARLPDRPAFASGELNLTVSTASRRLTVTAEPVRKTLEPGGETTIDVAVTDHRGNPAVQTEVAVVAVDESVLALTDYRIANPLEAFYRQLETGTDDYYSRENILPASPEDLLTPEKGVIFGRGRGDGSGSGSGSGDGDGSGLANVSNSRMRITDTPFRRLEILTSLRRPPSARQNQIRIRRNFDALAIFSPSVRTDAAGRATVRVRLPDNLTRYRITAVAASGAQKFGRTESAMTARQPLMIRPSAPRFMNLDDRAELPVVVQNQSGDPLTVDVALRAANAKLTAGNGRRVTISANDRVELRFPVAAEKAGFALFQVGAVAGDLADAAEFAFPVFTPATVETFATYGTTDRNGAFAQPIELPDDVFPQLGGLEVTTSSTQLQELTDAFLYLHNYPFGCSEQVSSRILATAALRDVLTAFKATGVPKKEEIEIGMAADLERLRELQHADGGFSFWSVRDESLPYVSAHVGHALARAKAKGFRVPPEMIQKILGYLRSIDAKTPASYSPESRFAIAAYALYVRRLLGDEASEKARALWREAGAEKLSPESLGWLLAVLAGDKDSTAEIEAIKRNLFNRVTETPSTAHFVSDYKDGAYVVLASTRRADAVILEALLKLEDPQAGGLIPKIVRGLLAGRSRGHWRNTQENAFVLLALDKYFQTYEQETPNFATRIWFGGLFAGEQNFAGRSVDSRSLSIPMAALQEGAPARNLVIDKQGAGRLYYRIGVKYAPKNLKSEAADYGFTVSRTYEALDDPADVKQTADGRWTIRAGARVRVRLQMVAPARRFHVALVDNLPGGLEIVNSRLAVSESLPEDRKFTDYYDYQWFDHQNLRDERAEVFKVLLDEGVWNYSYVARATTPGTFVAPPAKAEEMYAPETFGRTGTDFVTVE